MEENEHDLISDLLPRYASLLKEGKDAPSMYPAVASHLERCFDCREVLASLLAPSGPVEKFNRESSAPLFFDPSMHPSASPPFFSDGLDSDDDDHQEAMRGFSAIQSGGRLLMQKTLALGDQSVDVVLTLHPGSETGMYRIAGEIYAEDQLPRTTACLTIGHDQYTSQVQDRELTFADVKLHDSSPRLDLSFEVDD